ncbi:hypothetical protein QH494_22340 [Sphingomonas sp. AR_OL41]|uniref:hypothetical protein n=1 Tax=Sphingomonas sp. AR_OL41 TaxID=3042729 RepID=UPI0024816F9F|nr:hypothetical protein [Sphingomonas sp. AR_OL41]MDH7974938.1 hypothetical protein [Sphingomonas sp. AR_OL41]
MNAPPPIVDALRAAAEQIHFAGQCVELHPQMDPDGGYRPREAMFRTAVDDAVGIWGGQVDPDSHPVGGSAERCSKESVAAALTAADSDLQDEVRDFAEVARTMARGVWIGPMKLCGEQVVSATVSFAPRVGAPRLDIALAPAARPVLARLSAETLERHLDVRFNGTVVARPRMNAQLTGGVFYLMGPGKPVLKRLGAAITTPC